MPDIFSLKTPEWILTVWSKDIASAQAILAKTLSTRAPHNSVTSSTIKFKPSLNTVEIDTGIQANFVLAKDDKVSSIVLSEPVFFENKTYEFDFQFNDGLSIHSPYVMHRNKRSEDAFHVTKNGKSIRGQINFGNDVGWFKLTLGYVVNYKNVTHSISFEVLPTKMDLHSDIEEIQHSIDSTFPLWRFSLASKTEHEFSTAKNSYEFFPLLWLAHFEKLRENLLKDVNIILNAPHNRLLSFIKELPADKLKGRLGSKLEEHVTESIQIGNLHKRFIVTTKKLNVDTMENRFIKMVLTECSRTLGKFIRSAKLKNEEPDKQILSDRFFVTLDSWQHSMSSLLQRPLFKEIGEFTQFNKESLVLQQKTGYVGVYKTWQQLKLYLDVFGDNASLSLKSVAELYEVWCFLEIRKILKEIGFEELNNVKPKRKKSDLEVQLIDGKFGAFEFSREDKIRIRLAHEPIFSRFKEPVIHEIFSWTIKQKPDILLEATFANGNRIHWIFDAKYQIEKKPYIQLTEKHGTEDLVPADAINQMHRYRDALIHIDHVDDKHVSKSRPIFGAFALYPGFVDPKKENPYQSSIDAVAIGAFTLLPNMPNTWLKKFFAKTFGVIKQDSNYPIKPANPDVHYVHEAARIPYSGMYTGRYDDLTLIASIEKENERTPEYLQRFITGDAMYYHTQLIATNRKGILKSIVREIKYCAVAVPVYEGQEKIIQFVYPVHKVEEMQRMYIGTDISGKEDPTNENVYWVLTLGKAQKLDIPIAKPLNEPFSIKLTHLSEVRAGSKWNSLTGLYEFDSNNYVLHH